MRAIALTTIMPLPFKEVVLTSRRNKKQRATTASRPDQKHYIYTPTSTRNPHQPLPHLRQNFHELSSTLLLPLLFFLRPTCNQYNGIPAAINTTTMPACKGVAKTALDTKNKLTQQNIMGVVIQHLYGRSNCGSFTLRTMSPTTAVK